MIRLVLAAALAGALPGCGLIDPDITDFDLSLPPKDFEINADQWGLPGEVTFPAVSCEADASRCAAAAGTLCTSDACSAGCGDGGTCEATVQVDLWTTVNLAVEKPELSKIEGQPIVSVSIEKVWFDVVENTLNVDAPELTIYVAPSSITNSNSPQALEVGRIPPVAAGETFVDGELELAADGEDNLKLFMQDYKTAFNIIVGGMVVVEAGDPVPMGLMKGTVYASATAGL